jgi:hypothetical protein
MEPLLAPRGYGRHCFNIKIEKGERRPSSWGAPFLFFNLQCFHRFWWKTLWKVWKTKQIRRFDGLNPLLSTNRPLAGFIFGQKAVTAAGSIPLFFGIANIKKIVCNKALIQWFCRLHSDLPQCYNESIYFIA